MARDDAGFEGGFEAGFETGFEARPPRATRMDVIPAGPERRGWSAEAKARIVAESFAPGANIAEIARAHDIIPQQLYRWRNISRNAHGMRFVPAVVDRADGSSQLGNAGEIVIRARDLTIHVPESAATGHIERVLVAAGLVG